MLMVACFLLGVATVPLAGGRLTRLAERGLVRPGLLFVALGLQVVVVTIVPWMPDTLAAALHVVSYALAAAFLWSNRTVAGLWVVAAGATANVVAILANGGVMPASPSALDRAGLAVTSGEFENSAVVDDARLAFLGDVFAVPASWPLANVFSVGDVLIVVGTVVLLHARCDSRPARAARHLRGRLSAMGPRDGQSSVAARRARRSASISAPASISSSAVSPAGRPSPRNSPAVGPVPPRALAASTTAAEFHVGCSGV